MDLFDSSVRGQWTEKFSHCRFAFAPTMDSTNAECSRLWKKQPEQWVIIADEQTQGRGRYGREWQSYPGVNIYLSLVWKNPFSCIGHLNLFWGISVYRSIVKACGKIHRLTLKWPNDIYIGDKKLSGILLQNLDQSLENLVTGIGINVYADAKQLPDNATSLFLVVPALSSNLRKKIIENILMEERNAEKYQQEPGRLISEFLDCARQTQENDYVYHYGGQAVRGKLSRVKEDGTALIVTEQKGLLHLTN